MDGDGGSSENGKEHVGNNGVSWDICSVRNWGTIPYCSSSSPTRHSSAPPSTLHTHQMPPPFPTTHIGFGGGGDGTHGPDAHHHLTCLKLGKRQYYEEAHDGAKKERGLLLGSSPSSSPAAAVTSVPRCQVEGCNVALADAKDYHKRHKVCELHSKAPNVVVHGLHQRFCQQCSRFHVTSEFDDTKRSCRRRLAGHNERRRKNSNDSIMRHPLHDNTFVGSSRFSHIPPSNTCPGRALSLLSAEGSPWVSPDISHSSSAALRELIAENRAALLGRPYAIAIDDHVSGSTFPHLPPQHHHLPPGAPASVADSWHRYFHEANPHVTLDFMQVPAGSSMELTSGRSRPKEEEEEECCEIWKSLEETHVV